MSKFFEKIIRPVLFRLDAESAHELGLKALRLGVGLPGARQFDTEARNREIFGPIERFGLKFENPLGIAAGFDKNGKVVNQLAALGFGFVEVGTVTYAPQPGNPKPRIFRLPDDHALINRLGFNNEGASEVATRLSQIERPCVVGINIGRNKEVPNEEAVTNYRQTFELVHGCADYIVINVSSPNTPDLRDLQSSENLEHLIDSLQELNKELGPKPILVKIAPDLDDASIESIVDLCLQANVEGIIATNTTISRDGLFTANVERLGAGGLSGKPVRARSTEIVRRIYRRAHGKLPIIGVGGIFSGKDAFEKIEAGACLLQAYTGFIYSGPSFPGDVNSGLADILRTRGFSSLDEAVGSATV
jgi:dihydroorotate dehydrogenase